MSILKPAHAVLGLLSLALLSACATSSHPPLPTVQSVDLNRYSGTWHEIAMLPNRFQAMCVADTRALYRPDGDAVSVTNQCRTADGKTEQVDGVAKVVEGSQGAKLRVSFFRPFYGDYWVLERTRTTAGRWSANRAESTHGFWRATRRLIRPRSNACWRVPKRSALIVRHSCARRTPRHKTEPCEGAHTA